MNPMRVSPVSPSGEALTANSGDPSGWCKLPGTGVLTVTGEAALTFLQAQVTCDMRLIVADHSGLGAVCSTQGRVQEVFMAIWGEDGYRLSAPVRNIPILVQRLKMYLLRSKAVLADQSSDFHQFGLMGVVAAEWLASRQLLPAEDHGQTTRGDGVIVVRRPSASGTPRFHLLAAAAMAPDLAAALSGACGPEYGPERWALEEIRAGLPEIAEGVREEFLPQMVNLDLLDGISFKKGCFTGQEPVARTHNLGRVKRRLFRLSCAESIDLAPGMPLYTHDDHQAAGRVVRHAQTPEGTREFLAVVALKSRSVEVLQLGVADGPPAVFCGGESFESD